MIRGSESMIRGVDVSRHQGDIDWNIVKSSGIKFAIIRAGLGSNQVNQDDEKAERNITECERLGIPYGLYIYSYALNDADGVSEAKHAIRIALGHKPSLGIYIDMEDADGYKISRWYILYRYRLTQTDGGFLGIIHSGESGHYVPYQWDILDGILKKKSGGE